MASNVDTMVEQSSQIPTVPGSGEESKATILQDNADKADKPVDLHAAQLEAVTLSYPDGGLRAWLVVTGTFCTTFSTFGFVNAWGVFQAYHKTHLLKDTSSSDIAWIGSMQYALIFLPAVLVGRLFDAGWFKVPFAIGTVGLIFATFLIGQCTKYWQFVLIQGALVGLTCGMCFGPVIGIIGHWFYKKRGFPLAINAIGSLVTFPWSLAHTKKSLVVVAVLYGFASAAYVSTFRMPAYALGDIEDVGRRAGMVMTFAAFGAIAGPPISGAINQTSGGFLAIGYCAGSTMLLSCLLLLTTRHLVLKRFFGRF